MGNQGYKMGNQGCERLGLQNGQLGLQNGQLVGLQNGQLVTDSMSELHPVHQMCIDLVCGKWKVAMTKIGLKLSPV